MLQFASSNYLLIDADEPGKQVRSAIRIKNVSKSHVAFKVTTTLSPARHIFIKLRDKFKALNGLNPIT
jgi:hypothetical protein